MAGTVHVVLPESVDRLFHRIMQHQAHHIHVGIPLQELKAAQSAVEEMRAASGSCACGRPAIISSSHAGMSAVRSAVQPLVPFCRRERRRAEPCKTPRPNAVRSRFPAQPIFFDVVGSKLEADGPRMREKPTLIVMHGGPGFDHSGLRGDFDGLADIAQVVYIDHRGNGRSVPSDPATWTLAQWGDDVHAFCDVLGIEKPIVLGSVVRRHGGAVLCDASSGTSARAGLVEYRCADGFRCELGACFAQRAGTEAFARGRTHVDVGER